MRRPLHLLRFVLVLGRLFQATRQEADPSLQAAEAYRTIVEALSSARQAAEDASAAAERAYHQVTPANSRQTRRI